MERVVGDTLIAKAGPAGAAGDLAAEVIRARPGAEVALVNGGGIRGNRRLPAGPRTRRDVQSLLPLPNVLVKLESTGAALREALERSVAAYPEENGGFLQLSGVAIASDPARPPGGRLVRATAGGAPLDPERRYTVATRDGLAGGGDGSAMLAGGARAPRRRGRPRARRHAGRGAPAGGYGAAAGRPADRTRAVTGAAFAP